MQSVTESGVCLAQSPDKSRYIEYSTVLIVMRMATSYGYFLANLVGKIERAHIFYPGAVGSISLSNEYEYSDKVYCSLASCKGGLATILAQQWPRGCIRVPRSCPSLQAPRTKCCGIKLRIPGGYHRCSCLLILVCSKLYN